MNDLAEKALHGLDVGRRKVARRPMLAFGLLGFALSSVVVVAGGRVGATRATHSLTSWFGLQDSHGVSLGDWVPGVIMLAGVVALVLTWIWVVEFVRRVNPPESRVWSVAAAWMAPFALGPPFMDTTVYSYTAFGLLQRHGLSPYDFGANRLGGGSSIVAAIEPSARGGPSGVGPLGTLIEHLSVSIGAGSALGAVVVLRIIGVLAAVAIAALAADLAGTRRSRALTLTILNPLLLLYVVSACHLDGVMAALILAALRLANQRRWLLAIVLACLAGSVSGQAFVVLPAIMAVHWLGRRTVSGWQLLGRDAAVAVAAAAVVGVVVPDGFGWLWTVSKQFSAHPPFTIATGIAKLFTPIVRGASYDDLAAGARITVITAMICLVAYLIATARQRALERTVGYSLLAVALLAPVLYPWYLLWGVVCLAPAANGSRRIAVLALCSAGCLLNPIGFTPMTANVISGCGLGVVAGATVVVSALRRRAGIRAQPISAGS
ncbi:MAG: polyprenol phosphomannose-dependent alpha 1,6 mannosyltransferase MptB [Jatrophihabitans sp.]|uniref:polyprenol phosphomannose-dependent alpha 1,6 mannosyltransferase MptB n=1 Tax=Jatrophihabitans sp. TaxID=1932789 RepID=UPI003913F5EE